MRITDFIERAALLKLSHLHTFASVVYHGSYSKAAGELRMHSTVVSDRIATLERAIQTPLIMTEPEFAIMPDGGPFLSVALGALHAMQDICIGSVLISHSGDSITIHDLSMRDLSNYLRLCDHQSRKKVMDKFNISPDEISRTIQKIERATNRRPLFDKVRVGVWKMSSSGEDVAAAARQVLSALSTFKGELRIEMRPAPTRDEVLVRSAMFIRKWNSISRRVVRIETGRLEKSKKSVAAKRLKKQELDERLKVIEQLEEMIGYIINELGEPECLARDRVDPKTTNVD